MWPYVLSMTLTAPTMACTVWDGRLYHEFWSACPSAMLTLYMRLEYAERQRVRKELEATQAALLEAEKRAAIGMLSAGVAHELNSPLSAIVMNTHMLRMPGLRPEEQKKCTDVIEKATERAKEMVHALLSYARPAPPRSAGDPSKALADCLLLMHHVLKPVDVETACPGMIPSVSLSTGELMRVLCNLLQNARHAVRERGSEARLRVVTEVHPEQVVMRVMDNGTGIAPEIEARIWEPFFTTKSAGEGIGLGLSLVRDMVEQARGTIVVESTNPEGTTFRFDLPRMDLRR